MSDAFDVFDTDIEEFASPEDAALVVEASPTTKLERRRKIEELFEEKRLRAEIEEFG